MKKHLRNMLCIVLSLVFCVGGLLVIYATQKASAEDSFIDEERDPILNEFMSRYSDDIGKVAGKTYYVDAASNEGNDGLSPDKALKTLDEVNRLELEPGDAVLFKRDCAWNGGLLISRSGTKEAPIVYSSYGEGANLPCINGNGQARAAVYGRNVSHIHIKNLEVTNINKEDRELRLRGIFILAAETDSENIHIESCYVHDVEADPSRVEADSGSDYNREDEHWTGGIVVRAGVYGITSTTLRDVTIEKNLVVNCAATGIAAGRHSSKKINMCTGMNIRNNYVKGCYGDGIIAFTCDGALIEGNVADHNGTRNNPSGWYVGIWIIWSDNCVIQYNESFGQGISGDGQGFDVDGTCDNTLVQYNYSHDNYGGFLLMMDHNNGHVTVRYNISVNDSRCWLRIGMHSNTEQYINVDIYNNTFYSSKSLDYVCMIAENAEIERMYANVRNNIFCYKGSGNPTVFMEGDQYKKFNFENNLYYGIDETTMPLIEPGRIIADPMFRSMGIEEKGMDNVGAYMLMKDSPALNSGMEIFDNGGIDYFGSKLKATVNIGAYDGKAVKKAVTDNIALVRTATMSSTDGLKLQHASKFAKMTDGDKTEVVATKATDDKNSEEWFEVDIEDTYKISRVVLFAGENNELFPSNFSIQVYDGEEWETVVRKRNYKLKDRDEQEFKFKTVKGSKVRVVVHSLKENESGKYATALAEIEAYQ